MFALGKEKSFGNELSFRKNRLFCQLSIYLIEESREKTLEIN
jgi:hypothetical protein